MYTIIMNFENNMVIIIIFSSAMQHIGEEKLR